MTVKEQERSGAHGSDDPLLAAQSPARSGLALPDQLFKQGTNSNPADRPVTGSDRLWVSKGEARSRPLISDEHIIEVNFSGRRLGEKPEESPIRGSGIPFGITADKKYVLMQGSEHSSICTAEAMLLLDVIGKYQIDAERLRPSLVWVRSGIDASLEAVADSLSRNLRDTGIEVDFRRYDVENLAQDCTRTDTILKLLEKLVRVQGSILLAPDGLRDGHVVLIDAVDLEGPIPMVRLREPAHGWQITVLGQELAAALGNHFETIQAFRPLPCPADEIVVEERKSEQQSISTPSRYIERLTTLEVDELMPGDLFITSLNGTQRLVINDEQQGADSSRQLTVIVKRQSESLTVQQASMNAQSMRAVLQVIRSLDRGRTQLRLAPALIEKTEASLDPVELANRPVILANAEILLGLGPEGLTLNRKTRHTTHGCTNVVTVDAILDLRSGALDLYNHTILSETLVPLKIEYGVVAGLRESLPQIKLTPLSDAVTPRIAHELNCAAWIASRFLFAPPELPLDDGPVAPDPASAMFDMRRRK